MNEKIVIIQRYSAPLWRIFTGTVLGLLLYPFLMYAFYEFMSSAWTYISGAAVEPPEVDLMSNYSRPAQNGYWVFVSASIVSGILLSALLPYFAGASIGKLLVGIRYIDESGNPVKLRQIFKKTACSLGLFLLIALPGPILGFVFGEVADIFSLILLGLGTLFIGFISFLKDASGRTWGYRISGIVPIRRLDIPAFQQEIGQLTS
jgi:RDD family